MRLTLRNPLRAAVAHHLALTLAMTAPVYPIDAASRQPALSQDQVFAGIAAAAGMPPLEGTSLPLGAREIRMRFAQEQVCCEPRPMLRLVEDSDSVHGELWLFRTLSFIDRPGNPQPRPDERCAPLVGAQVICVRPWHLSGAGEWAAVAATLKQSGAWDLVDPCRPTRIQVPDGGIGTSVSEGGVLSVQRLVGATVSSFSCAAPGDGRDGERLKVKALYDYFVGLGSPIPHAIDP